MTRWTVTRMNLGDNCLFDSTCETYVAKYVNTDLLVADPGISKPKVRSQRGTILGVSGLF